MTIVFVMRGDAIEIPILPIIPFGKSSPLLTVVSLIPVKSDSGGNAMFTVYYGYDHSTDIFEFAAVFSDYGESVRFAECRDNADIVDANNRTVYRVDAGIVTYCAD